MPSFLGGGVKPHYIPSAVKAIISRSEFYSSYTPYQPEASQGFLQAMFEYQSILAEITEMDIANASLYDDATALGEAALMCSRISKKKVFLFPENISWDKQCILANYAKGAGIEIRQVPYDRKTGMVNVSALESSVDSSVAGMYLENPNYFGVFEAEVDQIHTILDKNSCLYVVGVDPLSLGIVRGPGSYDADIVIGEGRALGNPMSFGGGSLGLFACRKKYLRYIPGRIIGMTEDANGDRAFCMTLQTREQHIRRGRATSNICTNEGLYALAAVSYVSLLGAKGLYELGKTNFENAQKLAQQISNLPGYENGFEGTHFNEFVIHTPNAKKVNQQLLQNKMQGGLLLEERYPELANCLLFGVTELHQTKDIECLLQVLSEVR
jgi:glycine dehydrogenase subunit 1